MIRVNIITEGQTEETFVRDILASEFGTKEIFFTARSVETSRSKSRIYRGGLLDYEKAKKDILRWLKQDKEAVVTTMFDLYALPDSFPGKKENKKIIDPYKLVSILEERFFEDINAEKECEKRFIPYIQLHEFEGLLFSDIEKIHEVMKVNKDKRFELVEISEEFNNPELINQGSDTAPSKRLSNLYPGYDKITNGAIIASKIGLSEIRRKCSHFNEWLSKIESL
jgi:hypothetical protein